MLSQSLRQAGRWLCLGLLLPMASPRAVAEGQPEWRILADPARLEAILDTCHRASLDLRMGGTPDMVNGNRITVDCLIEAAVEEFGRNLATPHFPPAEFQRRLRQLILEEADLYVDLNIQHLRCFPCGTIWGPARGAREMGNAEAYLRAIWAYYRERALEAD